MLFKMEWVKRLSGMVRNLEWVEWVEWYDSKRPTQEWVEWVE